jgi:hypothetical protein
VAEARIGTTLYNKGRGWRLRSDCLVAEDARAPPPSRSARSSAMTATLAAAAPGPEEAGGFGDYESANASGVPSVTRGFFPSPDEGRAVDLPHRLRDG